MPLRGSGALQSVLVSFKRHRSAEREHGAISTPRWCWHHCCFTPVLIARRRAKELGEKRQNVRLLAAAATLLVRIPCQCGKWLMAQRKSETDCQGRIPHTLQSANFVCNYWRSINDSGRRMFRTGREIAGLMRWQGDGEHDTNAAIHLTGSDIADGARRRCDKADDRVW